MTTNKFKIWDNETQSWFTPKYLKQREEGYEEEILISQQGEVYLNKTYHDGSGDGKGLTELIHYPPTTADAPCRFIPCLYVGHRDVNGVKWYLDDIVKVTEEDMGVLIWYQDRLAIGKNHDGKEFQSIKYISHLALRESTNLGNINNPADKKYLD